LGLLSAGPPTKECGLRLLEQAAFSHSSSDLDLISSVGDLGRSRDGIFWTWVVRGTRATPDDGAGPAGSLRSGAPAGVSGVRGGQAQV